MLDVSSRLYRQALAGLLVGFVPAALLNRSILHSQAPEFAILKFLRR